MFFLSKKVEGRNNLQLNLLVLFRSRFVRIRLLSIRGIVKTASSEEAVNDMGLKCTFLSFLPMEML
jgi:hypothetical protein